MTKYPPSLKHSILLEYRAGDRTRSFRALARLYKIKGGESVVRNWYYRWKSTPESLERKPGSGGHAVLTPALVDKYIRKPVEKARDQHKAIEYRVLKEPLEKAVGHPMSLRTIQYYGKETVGILYQTTIPRTPQECTIIIYNSHFRNCRFDRTATHQIYLLEIVLVE